MRFARLALLTLLASPVAAAAAPDPDIVVRADVHRTEIERILEADNVDTSRLSARHVADLIANVERGRAPRDFWTAYRAHVAAWDRLAEALDAARGHGAKSGFAGTEEVVKAEQAIEATFDEVERIARRYGARMPTPPWQVLPTI